jgi:uncharacterized protein
MIELSPSSFICFSGPNQIAAGSLPAVAIAAWHFGQKNPSTSTLTFDRKTGKVVDLNLSGTSQDVANRYQPEIAAPAKRGRPKLGVMAREITLLPRHWEWLAQQQGGASVALRKLVDAARKNRTTEDQSRERIAAAYSFMSAIAGDFPSFEEASRALFALEFAKLKKITTNWPKDIRDELMLYMQHLAEM